MQLFQCKTRPLNEYDKFNEFLDEGFIAIGYPEIGDLKGLSKEVIRQRLEGCYKDSARLRYHLGMVNSFVNIMSSGDVVLIENRNNGNVHVGVLGSYQYVAELDTVGLSHHRSVTWKGVISRSELTSELKEFIRNRPSVTQFKHPFEVAKLERYLTDQPTSDTNELVNKAISILAEEMESEVIERRTKAAIALLQYFK